MFKKLSCLCSFLAVAFLISPALVSAYEVPAEDSGVRYFYVFGPEGDPLVGAEDNELSLFFDVPAAETNDVVIEVYDPDTAARKDFRLSDSDPFDTVTEISVHGESQLDSQTFGAGDSTYNQKRFQFGPYPKSKGKQVGKVHRFRVDVKATSGNDGNLFNVRVSPDSAEIFSENITFRLVPRQGDKMYFYPEVPAGTKYLVAENYDLDAKGGTAVMVDKVNKLKYDINESVSGVWTETQIPIAAKTKGRLQVVITKATQRSGHAGLRFRDDKGKLIPIYFKKGPEPVVAKPVKRVAPAPKKKAVLSCNQFTFDARSSYDQDNDKITYLWDFGDGTQSEKAVVSHVYDKGGAYNVKLTVTDNSGLECETATTYQEVQVNTPPTASLAGPDLTCAGEEVTLSAAGSSDEESSSLDYRWSFDDGSSAEGSSVKKVFREGGTYRVNLTVDDGQNSSCSLDGTSHVIRVNTPPVANAGTDVDMCLTNPSSAYRVVFDAGDSYDSDRSDDLTYTWDFGDGNTAQGRRVEHTYAQGGSYTARLSVEDSSGSACAADSDTVKVNLTKAPVAVAGEDKYACVGTSIDFSGAKSMAEKGDNLSYSWNFGDGNTGTGKSASHAYEQGGDYIATLTVNNGSGGECAESVDNVRVHINSGPKASLKAAKSACSGDKVTFDASDSFDDDGDSLRYRWDFGDGTVVDGGSKVSHQYREGGTYKVTVSVDDGSGSPCGVSVDTTTVTINTPPIADAGDNLVCCQNAKNVFDAGGSSDPDGDKLSYYWDLGDGNTSTSKTVEHAYAEPGTYKVRLTVDDGSGGSCSTSSDGFMANVNAKPVPVIKISQN